MEIIHGIGIDIVNLARIEQMINRWGEKFLCRTFSPEEIAYCSSKAFPGQHYGARFAAKEAVFKALGTGWNEGIGWHDIEVRVDPSSGQPEVVLSEKCLTILGNPPSYKVFITLSHDKGYAVAQALILKSEDPFPGGQN